jgi:hypothetical protein
MKLLVLLAVLTLATCPALRSADPVLKADFASEGLPEGWKGLKGEWKVVDGALVGSEVRPTNTLPFSASPIRT